MNSPDNRAAGKEQPLLFTLGALEAVRTALAGHGLDDVMLANYGAEMLLRRGEMAFIVNAEAAHKECDTPQAAIAAIIAEACRKFPIQTESQS